MIARILSTLVFWVLMIGIIAGALIVVPFLYLPYVALKAAWLAVTGRLHEATGGDEDTGAFRPHIG